MLRIAGAPDLQPATERDFPEIAALTNRTFGRRGSGASGDLSRLIGRNQFDDTWLREDLARTPAAQLLVWRNPEGVHLGHVLLEPRAADSWHLGLLAVRPGLLHRGLHRALLAAAEDYVCNRGAVRIRLTVRKPRAPLLAWYLRRGYRLTGQVQPLPRDPAPRGGTTRGDDVWLVMERVIVISSA